MTKSLVIVESPAKAKTIKKYLGSGFEVKASVGHIIDLPSKSMGVDLESGDFTPEYAPIMGKGKVIKEIQIASKKADIVYLAPDPDREGEAIAFHLANIVKEVQNKAKKNKKVAAQQQIMRVRFHEITQNAIKKAFKEAGKINSNLYEAQQARRILDRVVGYKISPILWKKVRRGLSAGRVQSVVVRIIVDREVKINKFIKDEYWNIEGLGTALKAPDFNVKLVKSYGKKTAIINESQALKAKNEIESAKAKIAEIKKNSRQRKSRAPFITSKLQQDAARALHFNPKRTMRIAQNLYESIELGQEGSVGLISYMRTDSTRVSADAIKDVREYIGKNFGNNYLPEKPNFFKSKKSAQEAHEAIRPTSMKNSPAAVKSFLKPEQFKLYKLIWERFMASQMLPARYDQTRIDVSAGEHILRATGSILRFDGFLKVYQEKLDEDDSQAKAEAQEENNILPDVNEGEEVKLNKINATQHFTQPPPRYNEANLVKELEEKGIGRPSTYASILSTIEDKGYVEKIENQLHPSELGTIVTELLVEFFPHILEVAFTAGMEETLDKVEIGEANWVKTLRDFYGPFDESVTKAQETMRNIKRMEEKTDVYCEKCSEHMVVKWGKVGSFLGCSAYPKCSSIKPYKRVDGKIVVVETAKVDIKCKDCGSAMVVKKGRYGDFLGCSRYPECTFTMPMPTGIKCPKDECKGDAVFKKTKRGRAFYGCSNYPDCDFVSWNKPIIKPYPSYDSKYLIEKKTKGQTII